MKVRVATFNPIARYALLAIIAIITVLAHSQTDRANAVIRAPAPELPVCINSPANLVAWYRGEGNGNDATGGNNGLLQNGVAFSPGRVGQAFDFDGVDDGVKINASPSLNVGLANGFTLLTWINPSDLNVRQPIFEWNSGVSAATHFWISVNCSANGSCSTVPGALYASIPDGGGGGAIQTSAVLTANQFQLIALTYDKASGLARLYRNGTVVAAQNIGSLTAQTGVDLYLGMRRSGSERYKGLLDETDVYARALAETEIQAIFDASSAGKCLDAPNTPPTITTSAGIMRQQGTITSATIATVNDAETPASNLAIAATTVPAGISLTNIVNTYGVITASITPGCNATLGANTVVLTVSDGSLTTSATLTITITSYSPPTLGSYNAITIPAGGNTTVSPSVPPSDNGSIVSVTVTSPGIVAFLGTLSVNSSTGMVTIGNARPVGSFPIMVTLTDNCGTTVSQIFTLTVTCPTIIIGPASLPDAIPRVAYSLSFTGSGGTSPYTFSLINGAFPDGLMLTGGSTLSGAPTRAGSFPFTVKTTDRNGCTATRDYTLNVNCEPVSIAPTTLANGIVDITYNTSFAISFGGMPYEFSLISGALPPGLTLTSGGLLSGTPTRVGSFAFTLKGMDSAGCTATRDYVLTVNNAIPIIATLDPASTPGGSLSFVLTVNGSKFVNGASVQWNGVARPTIFISPTQLRANISAADVANANATTYNNVTVVNPTPSAGGSNVLTFTVTAVGARYEADVALRPNGDGRVNYADRFQIARWVMGLGTPISSEFQRADCAPLSGQGNGRLDLSDVVQAGRYAAGLDRLRPAGGPSGQSFIATDSAAAALAFDATQNRTIRVVGSNFQRDQIGTVSVEFDALANENAIAFTLSYDPRVLTFVDAKPVAASTDVLLTVSTAQSLSGKVGIVLALGPGQIFSPGTQQVMQVRFISVGGDGISSSAIAITDDVVPRETVDFAALASASLTPINSSVTVSGRAIAHTSAASFFLSSLAADSIVSVFGAQLATSIIIATTVPLPTSLGGTTVNVTDSAGTQRAAPLFFVSPGQINYLIPPGASEGVASVRVTNQDGVVSTGLINIAPTTPALFAANANGRGVPAADLLRARADGSQAYEPVARFDAASQQFVAAPIDFGPDLGAGSDQLFLVLYGTGIKGRTDLSDVRIKIGGTEVEVLYAGAQGVFAGLDQINVRLPRSLAGRGDVDMVLTVDGKPANTLRINFK